MFQIKKTRLGNVEDIVNSSLCMGCGVCEPVCPVRCIKIDESETTGQQIPIVDQSTCIAGCDVCLRVCPGEEVDFDLLNEKYIGKIPERKDIGHVKNTIVGHASDSKLRFSASSGGALTALLVYLLEKDFIDGAVVVRMNADHPHMTEVIIARTVEDLLASKGSKYCPASSGQGLRAIMREPGRYAFVGLSCHVHAARKFQEVFRKYSNRIVLNLGLFCGGGITFNGTRFLLEQLDVEEEELVQLTLRGDGWPGKTTAVKKDGTRCELNKRAGATTLHEAATYTSWMHRYFFPPRCLTCTDLTAQLADISFGDPWLDRFTKNDTQGLSMMVVRTTAGQRFLDLAIRDGAITAIDNATPQEVADSQKKLNKKIQTRPYRIAAKFLGIATPNYGELYNEGSSSPIAIASAIWDYTRLWLGRNHRLWKFLLLLEEVHQHRIVFQAKWRGRIIRLMKKITFRTPPQ